MILRSDSSSMFGYFEVQEILVFVNEMVLGDVFKSLWCKWWCSINDTGTLQTERFASKQLNR